MNFTYTIDGNILTIIPSEALKDNMEYNVNIGYIKSKTNNNKYSTNLSFSLVTTLSPMYCSLTDLLFLVDIYNVPENTILYYIREASKYVDYIMDNATSLTSSNITFPIREFVKIKVSIDCLLRVWVTSSTNASNTGTLGDISYGENDNSINSLKNLLNYLKVLLQKWEDAIKGYKPGRAKPISAKKGYKELYPTSFDQIVSDITRSFPSQT